MRAKEFIWDPKLGVKKFQGMFEDTITTLKPRNLFLLWHRSLNVGRGRRGPDFYLYRASKLILLKQIPLQCTAQGCPPITSTNLPMNGVTEEGSGCAGDAKMDGCRVTIKCAKSGTPYLILL